MARYQIQVFGKPGCEKCKVLNRRIESVLQKEEEQEFEHVYLDVETEDGIVAFARAECLNPQRIPAFLIARKDEKTGEYEPIPSKQAGEMDIVCGKSRLYMYLGCQTDYSDGANGVITPKMIKTLMTEARG